MSVNEGYREDTSDPLNKSSFAIETDGSTLAIKKETSNTLVSSGSEGKTEGKDGTGDEKEKEKIPPVSLKELFRYATSFDLALMLLGVVAALIGGLCMPAQIILFGRLTNAFVYEDVNITSIMITYNLTEEEAMEKISGDLDFHHEIKLFGIGASIVGSVILVTSYVFVTSFNYAAERQVFRIRRLLLRSILNQEIGWFDLKPTNDFASRVTEDVAKIEDGIGEKIGMLFFFITTLIFSIVNAFVHGWELSLVVLCVFPVMGVVMGILSKISPDYSAIELKQYSKAGSVAEEVLSSIRTVFAFGGQVKEVERFEKRLIEAKPAGIKRGMVTGVGVGAVYFLINASYALAFWYGTKLIFESLQPNSTKSYDPNDLIVVFFSVLIGAMNVGQTTPYFEAIFTARGAAASIYSIIERESQIDPSSSEGLKPARIEGTIELKGVSFSYPSRSDVPVLRSLSFRVKPGETVALVGTSGCGKSTCIQLIQRFYDPEAGSVSLDGNDVRSLNLGWLRDQIGIVGQEPVLFGTTIAENIRYGKESATLKEIQEAAKEANAHDFIMKFPKKYDTQVGDRGIQMSGGQKQRIAIARALVKRPQILLLDEATSALDNESEAIVQKALDKVRKGRTTIIVAHRLSTIKSAGVIVALKEGKVAEKGTHKDLMNLNGYYKSLVTAQVTPKGKMDEVPLDASVQSSDEDCEEIEEFILNPVPFGRSASFRCSTHRRRGSTTSLASTKSSKKALKNKQIDDDDVQIAPVKEIFKLNAPEWPFIIAGTLGAIIQGCMTPMFAILFGKVLGVLSESDPEKAQEEANFYSMIFLIIGIIAGVSMFFQIHMFTLSGVVMTMRLRKRAFEAMLRQELGWYDEKKNSFGALCSRLSGDASAVQGATGSRVGTLIQSVTTLLFCLILALVYNAKLGAVTIPFIPLILAASYLQMKMISGQSLSESKALEDSGQIALEAITNIRTVASLHREEKFVSMFTNALLKSYINNKRKSHIRGFAFGFAQSIPVYSYAAVMFYGGYLVEKNEIEYEDVFKVSEAMILGAMVVGQGMAYAPNYTKAKLSASRLIQLFNRKPAINSSEDVGSKMTKSLKSTSFRSVEFAYPTRPMQTILNGISLDIHKGEKIALVGPSGCGKSTIISLLERFYDVKGGYINLNDSNIRDLNVGYTRSLFGLVSQEPVLFDRTIFENIAYGDNTRTFSQGDVEEVAKQANIHDFIKTLPDEYRTRVGAKGTQLSGGQKQRIAIARALIRNPEVLLLDEATSALDSESELIVQETLEEVQHDRTSITIAHRLSTIRSVDKILVIDAGVIVEKGTHDELIEKRGHYWQLYNANV